MNPHHVPYLRFLAPWAAGIALGTQFNRPVTGMASGLCVGILLLLLLASQRYAYRFRWLFGGYLALLLLGAGYFHAVQYDERLQASHFARLGPDTRVFIGTVYDAPSKGASLKVPLRVEAAGPAPDSLRACSGHLLLFLKMTPQTQPLRYGDRLWVRAKALPAGALKNPDAFDYGRYLHFQNIHYQAHIEDRSYGVIATGQGQMLWQLAFRWRDRLLALLREHFPGADEYAVASALLVGYKDDLSEDLRTAYAETGSMHALAVSGTHVGLLYVGLLFLLRRVPWPAKSRRWGELALVLAAIWAFTLLTGATASVLRASVMFSVFLLGKAIRRQASVWNILAASAFGLLALNPYLLFDAGFQLSYAAVAGLVFFYPHFKKRSPSLPKWAAEGWSILLIGIAAQLGTLPLSLYYFHQFPVYFWLAGWVVVLGGAVFLWGGALLAICSATTPALAEWLGWGLHGLVWGMNYLVRAIQHLPGSVISGIWIAVWAAALLYALLIALSGAFLWYRPGWLLAALGLLAVLSISRAVQHFTQHRQREVVLYHTSRHFLLDFFDGKKLYTCADSLAKRPEQFAAQAHRWANGGQNAARLGPAADSVFQTRHFFAAPPFFQFFDRTIAAPDARTWAGRAKAPPLPVDVLVLQGNPKISLEECRRQFPCKKIVFAGSNSPWRVERWKNECRASGLAYHDTREKGAWIERW